MTKEEILLSQSKEFDNPPYMRMRSFSRSSGQSMRAQRCSMMAAVSYAIMVGLTVGGERNHGRQSGEENIPVVK